MLRNYPILRQPGKETAAFPLQEKSPPANSDRPGSEDAAIDRLDIRLRHITRITVDQAADTDHDFFRH